MVLVYPMYTHVCAPLVPSHAALLLIHLSRIPPSQPPCFLARLTDRVLFPSYLSLFLLSLRRDMAARERAEFIDSTASIFPVGSSIGTSFGVQDSFCILRFLRKIREPRARISLHQIVTIRECIAQAQ